MPGRWSRVAVTIALVAASAAQAQEGPDVEQLARRAALEREVGRAVDVRWDPATGAPASIRFDPPLLVPSVESDGPHAAARRVLERVGALFGATPPTLAPGEVRSFGPLRIVELEQRVGDTPVLGGKLAVTLRRQGDAVVCLSVQGRVLRGVPPWLPDLDGPGRVVTRLDDGAWRVARREVVVDGSGEPVELLRGSGGEVLSRRSLARHGAARGTVPGAAGAQPLRDLWVERGGERSTTDEAGAFDGVEAALPWGLSGPFERVVPRTGADYPAARDGVLSLDFPADDLRRAEVSVFFHLVETRRFFGTIPGLPRAAVDTPVAAQVGLGDLNAFASPTTLTLEGRTFRHAVAFGYRIGLDPAIVTHERGHVLLFALGFDAEPPATARAPGRPPRPAESDAIHEGLADYLAAARLGSPHLGTESGGDFSRSIDDDKVYPQDLSGGAHEDGMILSGALWDARRAAAGRASSIDAAALAAVPGLTGSSTMPGLARDIVARAATDLQPLLREHLAAHGLLPGPGDRPPLIEVRPAGEQDPARLSVEAGRALAVTVLGLEAGRAPGRVDVLVAGPRFLTTRPGPTRGGATTVHLRLTPGATEVGAFELTITAQSRRSGKQAVRTVAVMVLPAAARRPGRDGVRVLQAVAGQVARVPLSTVAPALPGGLPARLTLSGWRSGGVAVVGSELVLTPREDEVGTHEFSVHAEPDFAGRSMTAPRTNRVVLVVRPEGGGVAAEVDVHEEQPPQGLAVVPPGESVRVHAGETARLLLRPVRHPTDAAAARPRPVLPEDEGGPLRAPTDPWRRPLRGATVALAGGPDFVTVAAGKHPLSDEVFAPEGAEVADHTLTITPPADAPAGVHEVRLVLRQGPRELARRTVRVVVIPGEWRAPAGDDQPRPEGTGLIRPLERTAR